MFYKYWLLNLLKILNSKIKYSLTYHFSIGLELPLYLSLPFRSVRTTKKSLAVEFC